ncbi:MAG: hypothetical protein ABIE22_01440 [archaeon]
MDFSEIKKQNLSKKDRSDIGGWDVEVLELCKKINSKEEYYTTSSCSGRIVLLKYSDKKQSGLFLFRTHNKVTFNKLKKELGNIEDKGLVYFKQEPALVVVACNSLENAKKLLRIAKEVGFMRSGIMSSGKRIVVEIMSTEGIALPLMDNGKIFISDEHLRLVVREANRKLEKTREKLRKLEKLLEF